MHHTLPRISADSPGVLRMLIFSLASIIISTVSGLILSKTGKYRPIIWVAYLVTTLGMGLMIMLNYQSSLCVFYGHDSFRYAHQIHSAVQEGFPLIAILGLSPLFQVPLVALQAAMPLKDMATASSGFTFLRYDHEHYVIVLLTVRHLSIVGGAVGIAVGEAIIANVLQRKLAQIPYFSTLDLHTTVVELNDSIRTINLIPVRAVLKSSS